MSTVQAVRQLRAVARRDALIEVSYPTNLPSLVIGTVGAAVVAYYVSALVGQSPALGDIEGSYFDFVVTGLGLTAYASLGVSAFTGRVMSEQRGGTLEVLLAGPTALSTLLAGGFVVPLALTTVEVTLLVGVGVGLVGAGLSWSGVLVALPVLVLTVACFCALGVAAAGLVVLVKRGDPISGPIASATLLLSGAVFPVELFPPWLVALSRVTPGYWGVRGMREALLTDAGLGGVLDELAVLALMAAVLLPLSVLGFARAVALAKRLGVLATH